MYAAPWQRPPVDRSTAWGRIGNATILGDYDAHVDTPDRFARTGMRRAWLVAVLTLAVLAAAPALGASLPTLQPVVLPADHGAHPAFQVEWWYTAGTVADRRGRDFFWFATLWAGGGFLAARVNV